jgi:hypothetical protein
LLLRTEAIGNVRKSFDAKRNVPDKYRHVSNLRSMFDDPT